jgi:hypothetical protein
MWFKESQAPPTVTALNLSRKSGNLLGMQGAKISTLTAAVDDRVKALCLWDPVDVTVYAPQSPEYPSAVAALRHVQSALPVAVVGGGKAGDCVPKNSNYRCAAQACICPRARLKLCAGPRIWITGVKPLAFIGIIKVESFAMLCTLLLPLMSLLLLP